MKSFIISMIIAGSVIASLLVGYIAHTVIPERTAGWSLFGAVCVSFLAISLIAKVNVFYDRK
jgi:hypothetical protein